MRKLPSLSQWKQILKILTKKEKLALLALFLLTAGSFVFLITNFYLKNTDIRPAFGGSYVEGVVGQPRLINPIYGETNDIDRTLIDLIFSGLMTYDNHGKIIKDLADSYEISADGKIYDFKLKDNIFWHDGKSLTAEDIIFTIKTIQNSDYKSPLRANWIDVQVEKVSSKSVRFILKTPYSSFLENLTVKIVPSHIWKSISPENFTLSPYNLQPVGSGLYKFSDIKQTAGFIKNIYLKSNRKYHNQPSYIESLSFQFFENKEVLIRAANEGRIDGFALTQLGESESSIKNKIGRGWPANKKFSVFGFSMPRYFAVFFNNQKLSIFSDGNLRRAMVYSVNKDELIKTINDETKNNVARVDSPILPDFFSYNQPANVYSFDANKAGSLLDKAGFSLDASGQRKKTAKKVPAFQFKTYLKTGSKGTEAIQLQTCLAKLDENFKNILKDEASGSYTKITEYAVTEFQKKYLPDLKPTGETGPSTRKKLNELCLSSSPDSQLLKFTLTTVNQPQLMEAANLLKNYWQSAGVSVDINAVSITELKPIIKNRSYEALFYGQALGAEPDLYPFWHSSQKIDPGLNLSYYENKEVDKLLKEAREMLDESVKKRKYEMLQDIIINDAPALFLYNPDYIYWASQKVKGIDTEKIVDPAKRFSNITNWYLKTRRVWK